MSLIKHSALAAGSALLLTGGRFAVSAILARRLSLETFGVFVYCLWLVEICFLAASLGANGVAGRYMAELRSQPGRLATLVRRWRPYALVLPLIGASAATGFAYFSALPLRSEELLLLGLWTAVNGVRAMTEAALIGMQRFDRVFAANLLSAIVMVCGAWFSPASLGLVGVLTVMTAASIFAALVGVSCVFVPAVPVCEEIGTQEVAGIRRYALNIWVTALLWNFVWSRGEVPVLRELMGDAAVAMYGVALIAYGGAVSAVMLGITGIAPQITRVRAEQNESAAASICRNAMDVQLVICGIGALSLVWLSPEIILFLFGATYAAAAPLLTILSIGLPAMAVSTQNHLLQVSTNARYSLWSTAGGAVVLLALSWIATNSLGTAGAAIARSMTLALMTILTLCVCLNRWGRGSVSIANFSILILILTLSAVSSGLAPSVWHRTAALVLISASCLVLLKSRDGAPIISKMVRQFSTRRAIQ